MNAKFDLDTDENEKSKVWEYDNYLPIFAYLLLAQVKNSYANDLDVVIFFFKKSAIPSVRNVSKHVNTALPNCAW